VLQGAAQSDQALESVPALFACQELGIAEGQNWLQEKLGASKEVKLVDWLLELKPRFAPAPSAHQQERRLHPIERLATLLKAHLFEDARIFALDYLSTRATERKLGEGIVLFTPENPEGDLYVIASGSIEITAGAHRRIEKPGDCCNERVLMGTIRRQEAAVSQGCVVLQIPGATLTKAVEIFPALGISLYKVKIVPLAS
jgi:hypothetical protein